MKNNCSRCYKENAVLSMSIFNTEMICMDCQDKEKKHPDYKRAKQAEEKAVKNGSYNFEGIGKPKDL